MKKCPKCAAPVFSEASRCPACASPLNDPIIFYDGFISYRRDGGSETARLLRLMLETGHNKNLFLDVEELRTGRFDEKLLTVIQNSANFLLILSPGALDRCVHEDDWLRREIVAALESGRNIIPVLMQGFEFPAEDRMPAAIRSIKDFNAVNYSHQFCDAAVGMIARFMASSAATSAGQARPSLPATSPAPPRRVPGVRRIAMIGAASASALLLVWWLVGHPSRTDPASVSIPVNVVAKPQETPPAAASAPAPPPPPVITPDSIIKEGLRWVNDGMTDEAIARFDQAIALDPRNAEAFLHRSQAHLSSGDYAKARTDATKALALRADETTALLIRAEAAAWQEDREAALTDAERILALTPRHAGALALRALCLDSRHVDQILKDANTACDAGPENWLGYMARARALIEMARYPQAKMAAEKARLLAPRSCEPLCMLSIIAGLLGEHDEALSLARRALSLNAKSIAPLFALGTYYVNRQDADLVLQYGEDALRINTNSLSGRVLRGCGLVLKADYQPALAEFNHAIRLDPGLGVIYAFRSLCHLQLDEPDAASSDAEEAIRLAPKQWVGFLVRALVRLKNQDKEGALKDAREVLLLDPKNAQARDIVRQLAETESTTALPVAGRFQIGYVDGLPVLYFHAQNNLPRAIENCTIVAICDACAERRVFLDDGVFPAGGTLSIGEQQNWEWDDGAKLVISAKGYQTSEWVFDSEKLRSP